MDKSDVIALIQVEDIQDEYGVVHKKETANTVFCSANSVSANEFFSGGMNGLNPQFQFIMNRYDYSGEQIVEYNGTRYSVYRTFIGKNDNIEVYAELRKGTSDENQS